jgi:hypothetical protein
VLTTNHGLQAPKKDKAEDDEEDKAFKARKQAEEKAMKEARDKGQLFHLVIVMILI